MVTELLLTAMDEQERDRVLDVAHLMDVVHVQRTEPVHFDVAREHRELVDLGLDLPPVEAILPVRGQPLDVCQGCAIVPARAVELVGEAGQVEPLVEEVDVRVRHGELERFCVRGG